MPHSQSILVPSVPTLTLQTQAPPQPLVPKKLSSSHVAERKYSEGQRLFEGLQPAERLSGKMASGNVTAKGSKGTA